MNFFLASNSPRRKELLKYLIEDFKIIVPDTEEAIHQGLKLEAQIAANAFQKATRAAEILAERGEIEEGDVVIAADTVVYQDELMLKPKDEEEAFHMLKKLSGRWHKVVSGLAVIEYGSYQKNCTYTVSDVKFREMDEAEIRWYIDTKEPMDKAGSYAIQGLGARFIEEIRGDYYSVMGLPLCRLQLMLKGIEEKSKLRK